MDYEKAYKEALSRANKYYNANTNKGYREIFEDIFPELRESEDERIKSAAIEFVRQNKSFNYCLGVSKEKVVSWLEKQSDKVDVLDDFPTEFERQISHLIASSINKEWEYKKDFVKHTANALLQYAKNELEKQGEQKSWSEEDEEKKELLISILEVNHPNGYFKVNPINTPNMEVMSTKELVNWLKSLKDKAQPQPTSEWSKEDEEMYNEVLTDIIYTKNNMKTKGCLELSKRAMKAFNWFSKRYKSLKPQSTWKPSEEQIEAIKYFIDFHRPQANASTEGWSEFKHLESLYNNLKKL